MMATAAAALQDIAVEASLQETGLGHAAVVVDDGRGVPIIDLRDPNAADQLWKAATEIGFFIVTGHDIDPALIDAAFAGSQQFFAQSIEDKQSQSPLDMSVNCGFESFAQIRPSTGVPDQKESLQITARKSCMDGRWPSSEFETVAQLLLKAAHALANRLCTILEPRAVPRAIPGTLEQSHEPLWGPEGQCTLRFLHYPGLPPGRAEQLLSDNPNYWRAGPHTDWDNLTLLFQRSGESGLECCANPRTGDPQQMYWTAIPSTIPNGIAVNTGDMLARWSDGRLYSNLHRVRLPTGPAAQKPRYSIAYFAQSNRNTLMECDTAEPMTAGDYLAGRIQSNFNAAPANNNNETKA